ncbi:MAG: hypothetical protein IT550_08570 [Novosphingobium sp.]|nr:hypothetical protein [Novosphingobium sp.]
MQPACEEEPWRGASPSYAGWVPNVRSHLSFSMIGAAKDATAFTQPVAGSTSRVVMVHQHRVVNDYPMPNCLAKLLIPDIALHWVLMADTRPTEIPLMHDGFPKPDRDRQGMLLGTVYLLPYIVDEYDRRVQALATQRISRLLRAERHQSDEAVETLRSAVEAALAESGPSLQLRVALMRTGECRIWFKAEPGAEPGAELGLDRAELDQIAEQAYYFVKDAVHDHTHHDATSDQITPLYAFGRHDDEPGHSDELAWRRETLWSLSREIERLNREEGLTDQRKSLGIIAFAEAFQASLMSHVRTQTGDPKFDTCTAVHDFDFKHLKDSIKASIDVAATRIAQKVQVAIAGVTVFLATTSLVSSCVGTHNASLPKGPTGIAPGTMTLGGPDWALALFAWSPPLTAAGAVVVMLGIIALVLLDGPAGIFNGVQRVISQFGRALSVTVAYSPYWQWAVLLWFQAVMVFLAFLAIAGCLAILAGAIYL